jgi:hypothetical protein
MNSTDHQPRIHRVARPAIAACVAVLLALASTKAGATPFIDIVDSAITLAPTPTDYGNDYVEASGLAGMAIKVKNNATTGLVLMVRLAGGAQGIALGDLLVRTMSPPGTGGTSLTAYTPLGLTNLNLWSTSVQQGPFFTVDMDVRIRNLFSYGDAAGATTTSYTNTLVFTVIEP